MPHVLLTGPITGELTTTDGTTYDVSPMAVEVESQEHADELAHLIGLHYQANGHPNVEGDFRYDQPEEN
jgi:hypothetical protein